MSKRFIVIDAEAGVFIGVAMGFAFWSKWDPVGQSFAPSFPTRDAALVFCGTIMQACDLKPSPMECEVADEEGYATIDECVKAGAPRWSIYANDGEAIN